MLADLGCGFCWYGDALLQLLFVSIHFASVCRRVPPSDRAADRQGAGDRGVGMPNRSGAAVALRRLPGP